MVCDLSKIGVNGKVHGVPDLCVEIISPLTAKNDLGIKMILYAQNGVKEYWVIHPKSKAVCVYKLNGDRYELDEVYQLCSEEELNAMTDAERAEIKDKIQVGIFPDLIVDVNRIFRSPFN